MRRQLLRRREKDQQVRGNLVQGFGVAVSPGQLDARLLQELEQVDRDNTSWLKGVIRECGWPGSSLVGSDGADCAWLLAQHADHDPMFQAECLQLVEEAVACGQASPSHLAYLADRVLLKRQGVQRYGTQFRQGPDGPEPEPLEDPEHVDQLRAAMGLQPLDEYRKGFLR